MEDNPKVIQTFAQDGLTPEIAKLREMGAEPINEGLLPSIAVVSPKEPIRMPSAKDSTFKIGKTGW